MKLPSKEEVKCEIQFFLLMYAVVNGFIWEYMWLWYNLGLPNNIWMIIVPIALGLLSSGGLIHWIARN